MKLKSAALFWECVHFVGRGFAAFLRFSETSKKWGKEKGLSVELINTLRSLLLWLVQQHFTDPTRGHLRHGWVNFLNVHRTRPPSLVLVRNQDPGRLLTAPRTEYTGCRVGDGVLVVLKTLQCFSKTLRIESFSPSPIHLPGSECLCPLKIHKLKY